jgi:predicted ATPase
VTEYVGRVLTRLEVDGFKNLFDLKIDFGPYTCIAGPNAVGKSNVFDVIEFLSLIADRPFLEAAQQLRSADRRPADPRTLFWFDGGAVREPMKLAAEMIVDGAVTDEFGQDARPSSTFLRYEVTLEYVPVEYRGPARLGTIKLVHEDLTYIKQSEAASRLGWTAGHPKFRSQLITNRRYGTGYISTTGDHADPTFEVHQDGGGRGPARRASAAQRTVLSTVNTVNDPTIMAAKREMQKWRKLALEPAAMRATDDLSGPTAIGSDGSHLPAALFRQAESFGDDEPDVYARVAATASALTDVRAVTVNYDPTRDTLTLEAKLGRGPLLPARVLSDGTLRFLALSIIQEDPLFGGLICMEEPENGIHPAKIGAMVELLQGLAVDPSEPVNGDNPVRQVMVNTHSPRFVAMHVTHQEDLLLALPRSIMKNQREIMTLDLLPMAKTWRSSNHGYAGSIALIGDYLTQPVDAEAFNQLDFPGRPIDPLD